MFCLYPILLVILKRVRYALKTDLDHAVLKAYWVFLLVCTNNTINKPLSFSSFV